MNAITYRRVSTNSQVASELTQDAEVLKLCEREGWPVIAQFADPDTSGSIPFAERPDGARMLQFLGAYYPTPLAIVALNQTRLGRDCLDQIEFIRKVWDLGALPVLIEGGGKLPRTRENELKFNLMAVIAQDQLTCIRDNVRMGLRGKRERGELCGSVPYGYDALPTGEIRTNRGGQQKHVKRLVDNLFEQEWLHQMWAWRTGRKAEGERLNAKVPDAETSAFSLQPLAFAPWSYNRIARELTRLGVPTKESGRIHNLKSPQFKTAGPRPATGVWNMATVANLLKSSYTLALISRWEEEERLKAEG